MTKKSEEIENLLMTEKKKKKNVWKFLETIRRLVKCLKDPFSIL